MLAIAPLMFGGVVAAAVAKVASKPQKSPRLITVRQAWALTDRLNPDEAQAMITMYRSGTTARQVADSFKISESSVKRLMRQHGIRKT